MPSAEHDRGAAAERTRLAWRRTTLAATVVAVLLVRLAIQEGHRALALAVTAIGALCWVMMLTITQRRIRALVAAVSRAPQPLLLLTAAACACFAALGVVLVLA